jgi:hypothetical protein
MVRRLFPFALAALLGISLFYVKLWTQTDLTQSDFRVFYTSGRLVTVSSHLLYDHTTQQNLQSQFFPSSISADQTLTFVNPPYVALIYAPFTLFSPRTSFYLFGGLSFLLFLFTLHKLHLLFGSNWSRYRILAFYFFSLSFAPCFVTLAMTQTSIFSLFLLTLLLTSLIAHQNTKAGFILGAFVFKPQLLVTLLATLPHSTKQAKGIITSLITFAGITEILLGVFLPQFLTAFTTYSLASGSEHSYISMISWQGLFAQIQLLLKTFPSILIFAIIMSLFTLVFAHHRSIQMIKREWRFLCR